MEIPDPWPLSGLVVRTPRLELRPDDDAGLLELVEVAHDGIHPPSEMPFQSPFTDPDPVEHGRESLQHFWSQRAALAPEAWFLNFLVRLDGAVIGVQALSATQFAITREIRSGSWIGVRHHGRGYGTEMRAAVLAFAFDHLGARTARSAAFVDNAASLAVSRALGYRLDGTATRARRGAATDEQRVVVDPATFVRPPWTPTVEGLDGCAGLLGAW